MIPFDMNKPNPVPLYDFDANFVNNLESFTQTMTELLFLFFSTITNIVPCVVNLTALVRRFEITCDILPLSACIKISCGLYDILIFSFLRESAPNVISLTALTTTSFKLKSSSSLPLESN